MSTPHSLPLPQELFLLCGSNFIDILTLFYRNFISVCYGKKIINLTNKMMSDIKQVGVGEFGPIYEGIKGRKAVDFLILQRGGEIRNAFWHLEIGHIDLVWDSGEGKGLSSIIRDHPDAIVFLDKMIENGEVYQKTSNRVRLIARLGDKHGITIVRLDFDGKEKNWVLTGFLLEENI